MAIDLKFPTAFAIELARSAGILDSRLDVIQRMGVVATDEFRDELKGQELSDALEHFEETMSRLGVFQRICLVAEFERAMVVFQDRVFDETQTQILKLISDITLDQAKGDMVAMLASMIGEDHKSAAAIATAAASIMNGQADPKQLGKLEGQAQGVVKKFVMELTGE